MRLSLVLKQLRVSLQLMLWSVPVMVYLTSLKVATYGSCLLSLEILVITRLGAASADRIFLLLETLLYDDVHTKVAK